MLYKADGLAERWWARVEGAPPTVIMWQRWDADAHRRVLSAHGQAG
jgi:hypothetical protein